MSESIESHIRYRVEARHINHGWTEVASCQTESEANKMANVKSGLWWLEQFNMRRVIREETTSTILSEIKL